MTYFTMREIREANARAGGHWFEPSTMRFFRSRVGDTVYGGKYFISSERPPHGARRYTIRMATPDGHIETVGDFMAYNTRAQAVAWIKWKLKWEVMGFLPPRAQASIGSNG